MRDDNKNVSFHFLTKNSKIRIIDDLCDNGDYYNIYYINR